MIAKPSFQHDKQLGVTRTFRHAVGAGSMDDFMRAFEPDVMEALETASALLITSAVTQAHDAGESCNTSLIVCATTGMCARSNDVCRGRDLDRVVPCCQADDICIRRTETESRCRGRDQPVPSFWIGGEDVARVCLDEVSMET